MKNKMLFINPDSSVNRDLPNLSLAYAATYFNVKVIDLNTKPSNSNRYLDEETDILGISVKSSTYSKATEIANEYKKKYPKSKIKSVSGFLDVQCCYPFLDFENKIEHKEEFSDKYPFPKFEFFDSFDIFQKKWASGEWSYTIMTSQGCPFQCIYCASRNRRWKSRSARNCYEELKHVKEKYKIKSFQINDDAFNINKNRVIEFCELIKPLKLKWSCTNGLRADLFDEEIAKAMAKSGCKNVSFGVESLDPEVLKNVKKGETPEKIRIAIKIAKKYFRNVNGFFIIGLPGATYKTDLDSLKWVIKEGINGQFCHYTPFSESSQLNKTLYGKYAHSSSKEYPSDQQEKIYKMTRFMMDGKNLGSKITQRMKLIWKFDRKNMLKHVIIGSKNMILNRIER